MDNINIFKMQECDIHDAILLEATHSIHILNEEILKEDLKKENYHYIVAKSNDVIVGYAGISYIIDSADLISIVVSKQYTNMGVASLLISNIIQFCTQNNITKILLEVRESNTPAQKLYEKFEFKKISIRKKYYNNEDAYIYEKVI